MIYLLLIVFLIMLYLTFKKFDKDIIAPPVVLVAGYTLSIVCAAVNVKNWGIDLHLNTFFVLVYGTLLFVITGYIVKKWMEKKYICSEVNIQGKLTTISINTKYLYVYIAFQIGIMLIWVWNIYNVTNFLGNYESFTERMIAFRQWNSYGTSWINNYLYVCINQLSQISMVSPYLFLYIIVYNYFANNKVNNKKFLFISLILSIMQMLLTGARGIVIYLVLVIILYYAIFYYIFNKSFIEVNKKLLLKLIFISVIGMLFFYYIKILVGRNSDNMDIKNLIPYITIYGGGSIQLLDMFLQNPIENSDVFGKEVFSGLNFQLIRLGILNIEPYIPHLEFRISDTGVGLGNVYTAYRSYIYDFGFIGLSIFPIIFSFIVNYLYYNIILKFKNELVNIKLLFYSLLFSSIFFDFSRCIFYSYLCTFSTIRQLIFLIVLAAIFVKDFRIKNLWTNSNLEANS